MERPARPNDAPLSARRAPARLVAALAALLCAPAIAQAATCAPDATAPGGGVVRICMPSSMPWNGDAVIWAHGYVEPGRVVARVMGAPPAGAERLLPEADRAAYLQALAARGYPQPTVSGSGPTGPGTTRKRQATTGD